MNSRGSIYFWYDIIERLLIIRYTGKMATVLDASLHRRTNLAIIAISSDGPDKEKGSVPICVGNSISQYSW